MHDGRTPVASPAGRDEHNLATVRRQVVESDKAMGLLELYLRVLSRDAQVPDSERSISTNSLKLTGVVKPDAKGWLRLRNRIYAAGFDRKWAQAAYNQIAGRGQVRFQSLFDEARSAYERKDYATCLYKLGILFSRDCQEKTRNADHHGGPDNYAEP